MTYDGTLFDERGFAAIGGPSEALSEKIGETYNGTPTQAEALSLAAQAFREIEDRAIDGWEGAILERGRTRRAFRRLTDEELAGI